MRVLVTGASGFIGGHVARSLIEAGHQVDVLWYRTKPDIAGVNAYKADLSENTILLTVDAVVHCAGTFPQPGASVARLVNDNVVATNALVNFAAAVEPCKKFIYMSSVSVHGDVQHDVLHDATPIVNPTPYGATKLLGEQMLADVSNKLSSASLRLPGVIGRGAHGWLARVGQAIIDRRPIDAHSLESRFNNVVHVDDLCAFVNHLLESDLVGSATAVMGTDPYMPVRSVILFLAERMGLPVTVHDTGAQAAHFSIAMDRAVRLGFSPMPLSQALDRYAKELLT